MILSILYVLFCHLYIFFCEACVQMLCPFLLGCLFYHWVLFISQVLNRRRASKWFHHVSFKPQRAVVSVTYFKIKVVIVFLMVANTPGLKLLFSQPPKTFGSIGFIFHFRCSWELGKRHSHNKELCLVLGNEYNGKKNTLTYLFF